MPTPAPATPAPSPPFGPSAAEPLATYADRAERHLTRWLDGLVERVIAANPACAPGVARDAYRDPDGVPYRDRADAAVAALRGAHEALIAAAVAGYPRPTTGEVPA